MALCCVAFFIGVRYIQPSYGGSMADSPITFADVSQLKDPLLSFKWYCETLPSFTKGASLNAKHVEEVDLPFPNIQQKEGIFAGGTYAYYPGYETISAFDMTFYEDCKVTALKYLEDWRKRIRNPERGTFYLPRNFKRHMTFVLVDQTNTKVARVTMYNCWPTARGNLALAYTSNERIKIQQNFSTDGQKLEFLV